MLVREQSSERGSAKGNPSNVVLTTGRKSEGYQHGNHGEVEEKAASDISRQVTEIWDRSPLPALSIPSSQTSDQLEASREATAQPNVEGSPPQTTAKSRDGLLSRFFRLRGQNR